MSRTFGICDHDRRSSTSKFVIVFSLMTILIISLADGQLLLSQNQEKEDSSRWRPTHTHAIQRSYSAALRPHTELMDHEINIKQLINAEKEEGQNQDNNSPLRRRSSENKDKEDNKKTKEEDPERRYKEEKEEEVEEEDNNKTKEKELPTRRYNEDEQESDTDDQFPRAQHFFPSFAPLFSPPSPPLGHSRPPSFYNNPESAFSQRPSYPGGFRDLPYPHAVAESESTNTNVLGSGNFGVLRGGTFFAGERDELLGGDDLYSPYYNNGHGRPSYYSRNPQPNAYRQGGDDFFANFRDFADISTPTKSSYSQYYVVYAPPLGRNVTKYDGEIIEKQKFVVDNGDSSLSRKLFEDDAHGSPKARELLVDKEDGAHRTTKQRLGDIREELGTSQQRLGDIREQLRTSEKRPGDIREQLTTKDVQPPIERREFIVDNVDSPLTTRKQRTGDIREALSTGEHRPRNIMEELSMSEQQRPRNIMEELTTSHQRPSSIIEELMNPQQRPRNIIEQLKLLDAAVFQPSHLHYETPSKKFTKRKLKLHIFKKKLEAKQDRSTMKSTTPSPKDIYDPLLALS